MEKIFPVQIYNGRNIFKYFSLKPRIVLLLKKQPKLQSFWSCCKSALLMTDSAEVHIELLLGFMLPVLLLEEAKDPLSYSASGIGTFFSLDLSNL